jgi:hypothetical protein
MAQSPRLFVVDQCYNHVVRNWFPATEIFLQPMDSSSRPDTDAPPAATYSYKPSLMGAPFEFRLTDSALEWSKGRHADRVPYDRIRRLRLSFRPVTMQTHRFQAEIWPTGGPKLLVASTSWRSMVDQERHDAPYRDFIVELHRRIAAHGGQPSFEAGAPAPIFWIGLVVFAGASLALAALVVRALEIGAWSGAAIVGGFLALFLWQVGAFLARNRPATYRPDALPPQVLP